MTVDEYPAALEAEGWSGESLDFEVSNFDRVWFDRL
jgi:hypothetical protein